MTLIVFRYQRKGMSAVQEFSRGSLDPALPWQRIKVVTIHRKKFGGRIGGHALHPRSNHVLLTVDHPGRPTLRPGSEAYKLVF